MNLLEQINAEIAELAAEIASLEEDGEVKKEKVKRGRGRPPVVEDKEFISIWNAATEQGKNLQQVAIDLGIAPASASVRASLLRKKGNNLNQFRRGRRKKA
mgnify:CR=1 FL=1|tara:strand:+ start:2416 stop:2718 length:303 start_codon:yes stop_codon:yes gene_type:complete